MDIQALLILGGLSLAPVLIILEYYVKQDNHLDKEPKELLWKVFGWGMLMVLVAGILETNIEIYLNAEELIHINPILYLFIFSAVMPGVIEESLKFWVIKKKAYHNSHFSEPMDGIMYAVVVSLGFAALENFFYITNEASVGYGLFLGVIRGVLSVPGHALFSGAMGYYLGLAKFCDDERESKKFRRKGLIVAILLHMSFNSALSVHPMFGLPAVVVLVILMFLWLRRKIRIFASKAAGTGLDTGRDECNKL